MKKSLKSFIIASIITVFVLVVSYFEYVPFYVGITLAVCSFITAASVSIILAIDNLKDSNKDTTIRVFDDFKKSTEYTFKEVEKFNVQISSMLSEANQQNQTSWSETNKKLIDAIVVMSQIKDNIVLQCEQINNTLNEKIPLLNSALDKNTKEITDLNSSVTSTKNVVTESLLEYKKTNVQTTKEITEAIKTSAECLDTQTKKCLSALDSFKNSIDSYSQSAEIIEEANKVITEKISTAISEIIQNVSSIQRQNNRSIDELKETISDGIESLLKNIEKSYTAQTDSLTNGEEKIRKSIDTLCNKLSSELEKQGIDIDGICKSVEDMKQMSQSVEQSDKDLIAKISKICR